MLASDLNARSKVAKQASEEGDYTPPCEQIQWHRIILDESHNIKGETAQSRACLALHAQRKWCVTGTPLNTGIEDLQRQLAFIGVAPLGDSPATFKTQLGDAYTTCSKMRYGGDSFPIELLALLRRVALRHAKAQRVVRGGDGDGGAGRALLELPPKTERTLEVSFDAEERAAQRGWPRLRRKFESGGEGLNHLESESNHPTPAASALPSAR